MRLLKNSRGQGMTEYIIIVAIIAIAAIAGFRAFGSKIKNSINKAGNSIESTVEEGENSSRE